MAKKTLVGIILGVAIVGIAIILLIPKGNNSNTGNKSIVSKDNLEGKYKLKSLTTSEKKYTSETLKEELGRKVELEFKGENEVVMTTTYYSTDDKSSDSVEKFEYDDRYFNDEEDHSLHIYEYNLVGKKIIMKNTENEEEYIFVK